MHASCRDEEIAELRRERERLAPLFQQTYTLLERWWLHIQAGVPGYEVATRLTRRLHAIRNDLDSVSFRLTLMEKGS